MKDHLKWLYVFWLVPVKVPSREQGYLSKSSEASMDRGVPWFVHQARVRPAINIFKLSLASTAVLAQDTKYKISLLIFQIFTFSQQFHLKIQSGLWYNESIPEDHCLCRIYPLVLDQDFIFSHGSS